MKKNLYGVLLLLAVAGVIIVSGAFKSGQSTNGNKSLNVVLSNLDFATLGNVEMTSPELKSNKLSGVNATFVTPGDEAIIYFDIVNKGDSAVIKYLRISDPLFSAEGENMEEDAMKLANNFSYKFVYDDNGYQVQEGNIIEKGNYKRVKLVLKYNEVEDSISNKVTVTGLNIEFAFESK